MTTAAILNASVGTSSVRGSPHNQVGDHYMIRHGASHRVVLVIKGPEDEIY